MDTSSLRPESHIAQQSRRDKLRIQPSSTSVHHQINDFNNGLENLSVHSGLNPDLVQVKNVRNGNVLYEPSSTNVFSSDHMLNFATSSNVLPSQRNSMVGGQELGAVQVQPNRLIGIDSSSSSFANMSKVSSIDPQGCNSNWRSIHSHQNYDLMVNYAGGSSSVLGRESNQKPVFVGAVLSNNARVSNLSIPVQYSKPNYNGYQDVQSFLPNPSNELPGQDHGQKQFRDHMQFNSHHNHSIYQYSLHDVVTPPYGNESYALYADGVNTWMNRPVENSHQWSSELGLITRKNDQELSANIASDPNSQGLSLSLSSNPPSRGNITHLGEGYQSELLQSRSSVFKEPGQDSKPFKPNYLCPILSTKPSIISSSTGKSLNEMIETSNYALRNAGPLGPFTGYATILKSSRFLKPAQELLDEFCTATGSKLIQAFEGPARICGEITSVSSVDAATNAADPEAGAKGNHNSFISSAAFYSTNEVTRNVGFASTSGESYRPDYQQKKAQLLHMQEEVCRKYKQYHQQMQMVASSFESVAGLSAATPYVSLALKTVSRNFRGLKHAISDQLKHVTRSLGEDLLSPNAGGSSCKGDTSTSRMRYMDQSLQRLKSEANVGFFEPQHVWRPQRGLPERSVQILRAWLFEHFLHPYPTDNDKHMLATQTGLTRNQVSNWFINARVRVWKPMVEEIHLLESKAMAETNRSSVDDDGGKSAGGTSQPNLEQPFNNLGSGSMINKQLECSGSTTGSGEQMDADQWSQEKRSRLEFQVPTSMDRSVMNFLPYQRNGIDVGGLGAVSLTLGLRHGVENVQQQHTQLQQHEDELRRRFAGQMIHDFVG